MVQITSPNYLFDANLLIDFWRGKNPAARQWMDDALDGQIQAGISIITDLELWTGVKTPRDERDHKVLLARFRRYQLNLTVARRAGEIRGWALRQRRAIDLADLIIAATAEYYKTDIVTSNTKHFNDLPLNGIRIISANFQPGQAPRE